MALSLSPISNLQLTAAVFGIHASLSFAGCYGTLRRSLVKPRDE